MEMKMWNHYLLAISTVYCGQSEANTSAMCSTRLNYRRVTKAGSL